MMGKALSDNLSCMHTGLINNCSIWLPDASFVYPIALRKAKIVYNFGFLSAIGLNLSATEATIN